MSRHGGEAGGRAGVRPEEWGTGRRLTVAGRAECLAIVLRLGTSHTRTIYGARASAWRHNLNGGEGAAGGRLLPAQRGTGRWEPRGASAPVGSGGCFGWAHIPATPREETGSRSGGSSLILAEVSRDPAWAHGPPFSGGAEPSPAVPINTPKPARCLLPPGTAVPAPGVGAMHPAQPGSPPGGEGRAQAPARGTKAVPGCRGHRLPGCPWA